MTRNEYLRATNTAKISTALNIMRDTHVSRGLGIAQRANIIRRLADAEKMLFDSYTISEEEE